MCLCIYYRANLEYFTVCIWAQRYLALADLVGFLGAIAIDDASFASLSCSLLRGFLVCESNSDNGPMPFEVLAAFCSSELRVVATAS